MGNPLNRLMVGNVEIIINSCAKPPKIKIHHVDLCSC